MKNYNSNLGLGAAGVALRPVVTVHTSGNSTASKASSPPTGRNFSKTTLTVSNSTTKFDSWKFWNNLNIEWSKQNFWIWVHPNSCFGVSRSPSDVPALFLCLLATSVLKNSQIEQVIFHIDIIRLNHIRGTFLNDRRPKGNQGNRSLFESKFAHT